MTNQCSCLQPWHVDYGSVLGILCEFCQIPFGQDNLRRWLARSWACPVCGCHPAHAKQLVVHHDHFPDALWPLAKKPELWPLLEQMATFQPTRLCGACNSLDSIAKAELPKLPKWFSLSPDDMRRVRMANAKPDLDHVKAIWDEKRSGIIAEHCRRLWTHGVPKEDIRAVLAAYRTAGAERSEKRANLAQKVSAIATTNPTFRRLFHKPGNDLALVAILVKEQWETRQVKSFVYYYHRRHGDTAMEQRPQELGPVQFIEWLVMAATDQTAADDYYQRCRFWRERDRAVTG